MAEWLWLAEGVLIILQPFPETFRFNICIQRFLSNPCPEGGCNLVGVEFDADATQVEAVGIVAGVDGGIA